jgi:serine/threonine-protein kinase
VKLHPGDTVGDYRIVKVLGSGGSGEVFQAEHQITRRVEALKVLLSGGPSGEADRFLREIQVQASLNHPHIASVHNAFWAGEDLVMAMEFVEGESLDKILERGRLPLKTTLEYARQALEAIEYAHAHGVMHRDIKPANMIVTPGGSLKLTDFGLAKAATDARLTQSGAVVGTVYYMPPEQVKSAATVDGRADIYSLGAVLYELAAGRRPFDAESPFDVMLAHVQSQPTAPCAIQPNIPRTVSDAILKALAKAPADRFASAAEFAEALREVPASVPRRKWPWTGIAAAIVVLAGLASIDWKPAPPPKPATTPVTAPRNREPVPVPARPLPKQPPPAAETPRGGFHRIGGLDSDGTAAAMAFSPDGRWIAVGTDSRAIEIWDASTGKRNHLWRGHAAGVTAIAFSPDGQWLATGSEDGVTKVWDPATQKEQKSFAHGHAVTALAFSPDAKWIAAGTAGKHLRLWRLGEEARAHEIRDMRRAPEALAFSPHGHYLAVVSNEKSVRLIDLSRGFLRGPRFTPAELAGPDLGATALAFSPDEKQLAVGGIDRVHLLEIPSGTRLQSLRLPGLLHLLAFRVDGRCLALCSSPKSVMMWDVAAGREIGSLRPPATVRAVALSPDGRRIAVAAHGGSLSLWGTR